MPVYQQVIIGVFAVAMIFAVFKLFSTPLRWFFKFVFNVALGFAGLFIFNLLGGLAGITLGLNLTNAVVIGIFGLPGLAMLLFLKWMFII